MLILFSYFNRCCSGNFQQLVKLLWYGKEFCRNARGTASCQRAQNGWKKVSVTRGRLTLELQIANCERTAKCSHKRIDHKGEEEETDRTKKQTMPKDLAVAKGKKNNSLWILRQEKVAS